MTASKFAAQLVRISLLAILISAICNNNLNAQLKTWTPNSSTQNINWSEGQNWTPVGVPGEEDSVVVKSEIIFDLEYEEITSLTLKNVSFTIEAGDTLVLIEVNSNSNELIIDSSSTVIVHGKLNIDSGNTAIEISSACLLEVFGNIDIVKNSGSGIQNRGLISNFGSIFLTGNGADGILNMTGSTINNSGIISISEAVGNHIGISNNSTFINSGIINITQIQGNGISNSGDGNFSNSGTIQIADITINGIINNADFTNSGTLIINYTDRPFRIDFGSDICTNNTGGIISIKNSPHGITTFKEFENHGNIIIDSIVGNGFDLSNASTFNNYGSLNISNCENGVENTLPNSTFINHSSGDVNITKITKNAFQNVGLENEGSIIISEVSIGFASSKFSNDGIFSVTETDTAILIAPIYFLNNPLPINFTNMDSIYLGGSNIGFYTSGDPTEIASISFDPSSKLIIEDCQTTGILITDHSDCNIAPGAEVEIKSVYAVPLDIKAGAIFTCDGELETIPIVN